MNDLQKRLQRRRDRAARMRSLGRSFVASKLLETVLALLAFTVLLVVGFWIASWWEGRRAAIWASEFKETK